MMKKTTVHHATPQPADVHAKKKGRYAAESPWACAGQWVLITGASGGIGQAAARGFWKRGASLVLTGRNKRKLTALKQELTAAPASGSSSCSKTAATCQKIVCVVCDLAGKDAACTLYQRLERLHISIDILVNNAGVGDHAPFAQSLWERQQAILDVNVMALTHLTWLFLPGMIQRKSGRILNVASVASYGPGPYLAVYYASKAYVLSFSMALSQEVKEQGIDVCCLCPGRTRSGFDAAAHMHRKAAAGIFPPASPDELMDKAIRGLLAHQDLVLDGALTCGMAAASHLLGTRQMAWMMKQINQKKEEPAASAKP